MPLANINILILCEKEHDAQLDRRSLRDCGFPSVRVMTSGIDAARLLANMKKDPEAEKIDLVLCHECLDDMQFDQFEAIIRTHPLLKNFPVLLIPSNAQTMSLDLQDKEFSDIITRPFSLEALQKKLATLIIKSRRAESALNTDINIDDKEFQKALASYGLLLRQERSTNDYFHMGLDFLKEQNWSLAISAFQKSVQDHKLKAEAELGMAAAYKGHNDLINFRLALANAAESFVRSGRWNRGRSAYARLLQHDKKAKNPFLAEAHRFIKIGDYKKAAEILQESLPLIPKGHAGAKLAQLCFIADDQNAMLAALDAEFVSGGMDILKSEIQQNLDLLNRQRDERERQKNAERKWEIKRQIAQTQAASEKKQATLSVERPELRSKETISLFGEDEALPEDDFSQSYPGDNDLEGHHNEPDQWEGQVLAPLTHTEATSELFAQKPKFNEFFSVIKLTWKLARRSKKSHK